MLNVHRRPSRVLVIEEQDRMRLCEALSVATRLLSTRIRTLETCPEAGQFHTMELRGIAERDLAALSNLAAALRDD